MLQVPGDYPQTGGCTIPRGPHPCADPGREGPPGGGGGSPPLDGSAHPKSSSAGAAVVSSHPEAGDWEDRQRTQRQKKGKRWRKMWDYSQQGPITRQPHRQAAPGVSHMATQSPGGGCGAHTGVESSDCSPGTGRSADGSERGSSCRCSRSASPRWDYIRRQAPKEVLRWTPTQQG